MNGRRILVRDLVLACRIGVYRHERDAPQRVRFNIALDIPDALQPDPPDDRLAATVDYEQIVKGIRALAAGGHINLVETLAERVAAVCLADSRVARACVRVEKLDVFPDVAGVGVEIERGRPVC